MKFSLRNLFSLSSILLLVAAAQSNAQSPRGDARPRTASIGGRVTVGGAPAANALVTVAEADPRWARVKSLQGASFEIRTDSDGRYSVTGLAEGSYVIRALSNAYVLSKSLSGVEAFRQVTLDEGESRDGVDLAFVRGGVITGRVSDAEGRPVIGAGLRLVPLDEKGRPKAEIDPYGRKYWWMFQTDDRGVYRIYGLTAGRYILSAGGEGAPNLAPLKSPETFYPDTTDWAQAKIIEVKEGAEVADIDIRLGAGKDRYEAAGRVIDAETGKPLPRVSVICMQEPGEKKRGTYYGIPATTDDEGRFTCAGLDPGRYELILWKEMPVSSEYYSEKTRFEVTDSDLSGLELKAIRGSTISGVVMIEGPSDPAVKAKLRQMSAGVQVAGFRGFAGREMAKIAGDGGFRLTGTPSGRAQFYLEGHGENAIFIKRIERDGSEIKNAFEIGRGEQITGFRILVAQASGTIRGHVDVAGVDLPEGCQLQIWASPIKTAPGNEDMPAFYSNSSGYAAADEKGRFVIERLSPGEYELRLNAMVRVGQNEWSSAPGTSEVKHRVTVSNGSETPVNLKLDLARK